MTNLTAIAAVLILGAGMCGEKLPEVKPRQDAGVAAAPEQPYIDRQNSNLRELKQDLQKTHDGRALELEAKSKTGEP